MMGIEDIGGIGVAVMLFRHLLHDEFNRYDEPLDAVKRALLEAIHHGKRYEPNAMIAALEKAHIAMTDALAASARRRAAFDSWKRWLTNEAGPRPETLRNHAVDGQGHKIELPIWEGAVDGRI